MYNAILINLFYCRSFCKSALRVTVQARDVHDIPALLIGLCFYNSLLGQTGTFPFVNIRSDVFQEKIPCKRDVFLTIMVGLRHRNSGGKLPTIAKFAFGSRFYSVNRKSLASILLKQFLERSPSRTAPPETISNGNSMKVTLSIC